MAPAPIWLPPVPSTGGSQFNNRSGSTLESTSDAVDEVNVLKASLAAPSTFDADKDKTQFRQYTTACERVKNFYLEQHTKQTVAFNLRSRARFRARTRAVMPVWTAIEKLNTLIDDSDPDTDLSQIDHLIQTAEAMRRDGRPRWMQLTGLIHDLGKLLYFFNDEEENENGEGASLAPGQWAVVGDTFPVGCAYSDAIIYGSDSFTANVDAKDPIYCTQYGIYTPGCGLDNVMLSWGHDEYLYHVCREQSTLPAEALAMIRYHSFYPWHKQGAYSWMMNEKDKHMLEAVRAFNPYDLYSKSDDIPKVDELKDYYCELIDEFFPDKMVRW